MKVIVGGTYSPKEMILARQSARCSERPKNGFTETASQANGDSELTAMNSRLGSEVNLASGSTSVRNLYSQTLNIYVDMWRRRRWGGLT